MSVTTSSNQAAFSPQQLEAIENPVTGVNAEGILTNLLQMAFLLQKADIVLVGIPLGVQAFLINTLAQIAQIVRAERSLQQYWNCSESDA